MSMHRREIEDFSDADPADPFESVERYFVIAPEDLPEIEPFEADDVLLFQQMVFLGAGANSVD